VPGSSVVGGPATSGASAASTVAASSAGASATNDDRLPVIAAVPCGRVLVHDPLLQERDAFDERLGSGRATGDVDVDRDDLVDPLRHRVRVPVRTTAVGARTHRDDVLRAGQLLV